METTEYRVEVRVLKLKMMKGGPCGKMVVGEDVIQFISYGSTSSRSKVNKQFHLATEAIEKSEV